MIFHVQCYARYRNHGMNNRQNLTSYGCFRLRSLDLDFKNPDSSQTKKAKNFSVCNSTTFFCCNQRYVTLRLIVQSGHFESSCCLKNLRVAYKLHGLEIRVKLYLRK